ncbi:MAG: CoA transferase [Chloroflexota bacterium]|nr:CoA transferase [Chloroflexota bacterium]
MRDSRREEALQPDALKGVKVVDFTWVIAGPTVTRLLAAHGATVVKVESSRRPDMFRAYVPMAEGVPGVNRCFTFDAYNSGKYSMTINVKTPQGLELANKLVRWADIVIESFAPGAMSAMGMSYEELKRTKSDIIMVSLSLLGQTGPDSSRAGFGTELQSFAGYTNLIHWPDREPSGTGLFYTDFIVPWYVICAIIAALEYRQHTGKGQWIDISQIEAGAELLAVPILDYMANSRIAAPSGNRCQCAAPHGAYRCQENDRWCAIAVFTNQEWQLFTNAIGDPAWAKEARFTTSLGRKQHEDELDKLIEAWTTNYPAEVIMSKIQAAGVAAGIVANGKDIHNDPQLKHRGHFKLLNHKEIGLHSYELPSWRLSKTPADIRMPSPCLGEHTHYVATEILGISDTEFIELMQAKVLE